MVERHDREATGGQRSLRHNPVREIRQSSKVFNCVIDVVTRRRVLDTAALDLRHANDGKPIRLDVKYLKAIQSVHSGKAPRSSGSQRLLPRGSQFELSNGRARPPRGSSR